MPNILGSKWNNTTYFGIKMTQYHILGFKWNQTVWNQNASHNSLQTGRIIVLFCSIVSNLKLLSKIYPRNGFWGPDKFFKNTNAFFCECKPNNPGPPVFLSLTRERLLGSDFLMFFLHEKKSLHWCHCSPKSLSVFLCTKIHKYSNTYLMCYRTIDYI